MISWFIIPEFWRIRFFSFDEIDISKVEDCSYDAEYGILKFKFSGQYLKYL